MVTRDSSLRPLTFWNLDGVRLGKVCNLKSNIFFILLYFSNNTKGFWYILTKTDFRKFDSLKSSMFSSISWKWLKLNGNQMCIWVAYWFFFSMKLLARLVLSSFCLKCMIEDDIYIIHNSSTYWIFKCNTSQTLWSNPL